MATNNLLQRAINIELERHAASMRSLMALEGGTVVTGTTGITGSRTRGGRGTSRSRARVRSRGGRGVNRTPAPGTTTPARR